MRIEREERERREQWDWDHLDNAYDEFRRHPNGEFRDRLGKRHDGGGGRSHWQEQSHWHSPPSHWHSQPPQPPPQPGRRHPDARDYYEILRVSPGASLAEIKRAYHAMAKAWHPDRNRAPGQEERARKAERNFRLIARAQEVLVVHHYAQRLAVQDGRPPNISRARRL